MKQLYFENLKCTITCLQLWWSNLQAQILIVGTNQMCACTSGICVRKLGMDSCTCLTWKISPLVIRRCHIFAVHYATQWGKNPQI